MSQSQQYVVRVPRELKKKYNVMRFSAALNVDVTKWKSARLERENNVKEYKGLTDDIPKFGAGSEFGRDLKEEARRKKHGIVSKKYNPENQPWMLRINGREGRKFKGFREGGVSENTSYYVFFQAHDGAFEAFPVSEWYNFTPIPKYKALTAEEAEEQFEKRHKILNLFTVMAAKKKQDSEAGEASLEEAGVKKEKKAFKVSDMDEWQFDSDGSGPKSGGSGDESDGGTAKKGKAAKAGAKKKKKPGKKKKKGSDDDDDNDSEPQEDSDEGDFDQREVDYMSSSSSSEDEAEAKVERALKAVVDEDALRQLVLSEDEDEEEEQKKEDTKDNVKEEKKGSDSESKAKVKQEKEDAKSESSAESEDSDDSDFDDSKFRSAMFMQNKLNKSKNGSENGSKGSTQGSSGDIKPDIKELEKQAKSSNSKRKASPDSSPPAKKSKHSDSSSGNYGITEEAVRRYLTRKPMTITELLQKFKNKKISMTNSGFMTTMAQILKKLELEKQTIKGKLYLSMKPT